ncbi:MAG TPA: lipid A export permease/ATP-binding protein MsbA [Burkholderiaceae bacterium]|nr:lipid A export permease/ATP-binding protein MsbA [Burkholderiaceae bacterium]
MASTPPPNPDLLEHLPALSAPATSASWPVLSRLLRYVRPYRRAFPVAIAGMALTAATEPAFPALLKWLLELQAAGARLADPRLVWAIPVGLVVISVLRSVLIYMTGYVMAWITSHVVSDLRGAMFAKLLSLPARFYDNQSSGALISKVVFDVNNVTEASSSALIAVVRDSLTVIGLLGYLVYLDWRLTLIVLCVGPVVVGVVRLFNRRLRAANRSGYRSMGMITHILEEATGAHKVVKIFGGQLYEARRFGEVRDRFRRAQMREAVPASATVPITQIAVMIAVAVIMYLALSHATAGEASTVGGFVAFLVALGMLVAPVKRLTEVNNAIQRGLTAAGSVFALLDEPGEDDRGQRRLGRARGEVRFEHVTFRYPGAARTSLDDVDVAVHPGEIVALVGASGSGKTTFVSLLPRFYAPSAGRILIDGVDIQQLALASLRENIALVSQDVVLFNDSVAANIAYGLAADRSEADVIAAARAAHAWEFIEQMPDGLRTIVGENGVKLSGGQRQRLAIARALLKDAPILILDEATSALDTESERHVQAALAVLMRGRTTFVIAHRLSTIEGASRILVVDRGRIVEQGRHDELLARGGQYAHLHSLQFRSGDGEPGDSESGDGKFADGTPGDAIAGASVIEAERVHGR